MYRTPLWFLAAGAVVQGLLGMGYTVGGIGVLKRSNAARLLTVAMAVLGVVIVLANTAVSASLGLLDASGMAGTACGALFALGFAGLICGILLSPKNAAEFRS